MSISVLITKSDLVLVQLISVNTPHPELLPAYFIDNSLLMFSGTEPNAFFELVLSVRQPPTCNLREHFTMEGLKSERGQGLADD